MKRLFGVFVISFLLTVVAGAQNYTIQQYLNIRSASSPTIAPDGKRLFYLTNVSGTSQVWMIDLPNGTPKQVTNYDDNVGFVRYSPKGGALVFGKARGGDENTQFFLMDANGANIRELTASPKIRHNFGGWSDDGSKIYYASNKRNPQYFDIYAMTVADGKEEIVYQFDGSNSFAGASSDGRRVIVSRSGTELSLDNNLYLYDTQLKTETLLTPHTDASQFGDVEILPDGDSLLFTSNKDREFAAMVQMDNVWPKGNPMPFLIRPEENWDVEGVTFPENGSYFAYTLNREGFSELRLRKYEVDGKPLITRILPEETTVKLPAQGIVGGLSFSGDGSKLVFTFNSSKHNSDVWHYDLESKSLTQITKSDRAGIDADSFATPELIKFKTFDGREIPAWYYKPRTNWIKTDNKIISTVEKVVGEAVRTVKEKVGKVGDVGAVLAGRGLPVIVSVHGGPEGQERPGFNPLYQYYLSRGYAILATNVRGSTGYGKTFTHLDDVRKREDSVKDLAYSVEWLKKSGGADPKRIAVMGGSYGGYMTMAAVTLYPDLWAAAVNTVGIVNWETFLKNTSGYRRRQREVEYGMLDRDIEFLRAISPIAKVDKIKAPLFVIHGKNDPRVPYTEAEQIVKALRDRNANVEYKLFDDEGHGISKLKNRLELYPLVADFLDKNMK
ncbi:MAG: S9 family peptidase [Acidobacteria bacterium]|nr:S9 family peptidase [Acidobacteriota bacterium]